VPPAPAYAASVPAPQATAPQSATASPAERAEPAERAADPNWNIGAGIAFGNDAVFVLGDAGSISYAASLWLPTYRLSLERRLGATTWFLLNGSLLHTVDDVLVQTEGNPSGERNVERKTTNLGGFLGLRQLLFSRIVDVSAFAGFSLARIKIGGDEPRPDEEYFPSANQPGSYANSYGLSAGIAVERELVKALAVRLSTEVFSARWTKLHRIQIVDESPKGTDTSNRLFSLRFAPAIDLRFYF
jgi:hypothetical protein